MEQEIEDDGIIQKPKNEKPKIEPINIEETIQKAPKIRRQNIKPTDGRLKANRSEEFNRKWQETLEKRRKNSELRKLEQQQKEEEDKKKMEELIIKKSIAIAKKNYKKTKILDEIINEKDYDDVDMAEFKEYLKNKNIMKHPPKETPIKEKKMPSREIKQEPQFYFI